MSGYLGEEHNGMPIMAGDGEGAKFLAGLVAMHIGIHQEGVTKGCLAF
jgi:hypothetical protein